MSQSLAATKRKSGLLSWRVLRIFRVIQMVARMMATTNWTIANLCSTLDGEVDSLLFLVLQSPCPWLIDNVSLDNA